MDDPLLVARGSTEQISNVFSTVLMWWMAVGLKIAWRKGTIGYEAEWIGAKITVDNSALAVTVAVTPAKVEEWRLLAKVLDTRPLVSLKLLQKFVGNMSWASGFVPQHAEPRTPKDNQGRRCCRLDFWVDASPWQGGAVRLKGGKAVETYALVWSAEDDDGWKLELGKPT